MYNALTYPTCVLELPRSADTALNLCCSLTYSCDRNVSETVLERMMKYLDAYP